MYEYLVREIVKVVDGDTVHVVIDMGFGMRSNLRVRLVGVDTPERNSNDFGRAAEMTREWLMRDGQLTVRTQKSGLSTTGIGDGAFGRWMGEFWRDGESLSDVLIAEGWGS